MSDFVRYELDGDIAILRIDDGKANALDSSIIDSLHGGLRRAEEEAAAVLLTGRAGRFSAVVAAINFSLGEFHHALDRYVFFRGRSINPQHR